MYTSNAHMAHLQVAASPSFLPGNLHIRCTEKTDACLPPQTAGLCLDLPRSSPLTSMQTPLWASSPSLPAWGGRAEPSRGPQVSGPGPSSSIAQRQAGIPNTASSRRALQLCMQHWLEIRCMAAMLTHSHRELLSLGSSPLFALPPTMTFDSLVFS